METITAGSRDTRPPVLHRPPVPDLLRPALPRPAVPRPAGPRDEPDQEFVAALRAAAPRFAAAAGAATAVVAEAVPPARHRRARCRVVLLYPGGTQSELTFLGATGSPAAGAAAAFTAGIAGWLATPGGRDTGAVVDLPTERLPP